jgi:hypothetical protein
MKCGATGNGAPVHAHATFLGDAMTKGLVLCFVIAGFTCSLRGQTQSNNPPSDSDLAGIMARGRALAGYDAAAWHSADALVPLKPSSEKVQLYIAKETEHGWVVMYGRFNAAKTKFLIAYEAQEGSSSAEYKVFEHEPAVEDGDWYLRAAKAHELAAADYLNRAHPHVSYNVSILPAPSGGWYVYAVPAQTENGVLPYGADVRYTVSGDGETITERRHMHGALLETSTNKPQLGFHTHDLTDAPEDSDVFYAMTINAAQGDWIVTKKFVYSIRSSGSIDYLGSTEEVVRMLQEGKFDGVIEPFRSMLLVNTQGFMAAGKPRDSVEAFASLSGQRCNGTTPLLKFSIVLYNTTEGRIVLSRHALWTAQVRFAATDADMLAGTYEKIVVFVDDKVDYTDEKAYFALGPGMVFQQEQEYPILGANLKGKSAVQFLFFTWPLGQDKLIDGQRDRWAKVGYLFTNAVETPPTALKLDAQLSSACQSE